MATRYEKENDYTLEVITEKIRDASSSLIAKKLSRRFNFLACQLTTTTTEMIFQPGGYKTGGAAAVSTVMHIQNFDDVQSQAEIALMHAELIKLKGNPPPLPGQIRKKGIGNG